MTKKKIRNNPNGNVDIKEWIQMIHDGTMDSWQRFHKLNIQPCPPYSLIPTDTTCTYCQDCFKACESQVKIYKDHYKIGSKKYMKSEFEKGE